MRTLGIKCDEFLLCLVSVRGRQVVEKGEEWNAILPGQRNQGLFACGKGIRL